MPDDVKAAVDAAVSEVKESGAEVVSDKGENTSESEVKEETKVGAGSEKASDPEPKKDAKKADEDDEEFWQPTAEELDIINKSEELKKVYRSMQKGLTKKSQSIAELRKTSEDREKLFNWLNQNPEEAANAILASIGKLPKTATAKQEEKFVDKLEAKWGETVGPEAAKLLRPLIEETIHNVLDQEVKPLRDRTEELTTVANERAVAASVREFGAAIVERGDDWDDDIQAEMSKVTDKIEPAAGTSIDDFLALAYDTVMARRGRGKNVKETRDRLRRIKNDAEPGDRGGRTNTTVSPERVSKDTPDKEAFAMALRLAEKELQGR